MPPVPAATVTVTCVLPETPVGVAGVPGTANTGVTEADAVDAPDVPAEFVAVVLNVYAVPFVKPVTAHELAGTVTVQPVEYVTPSVDLVTV